jgi:hypothetical protein
MDNDESTIALASSKGAPRVYQRRDGCFVVAHDEDGVTYVNKLTIVSRRAALDRYKDALSSSRNALEHAVRGAIASASLASASHKALEDAFAAHDFNTFHALEALREALKP